MRRADNPVRPSASQQFPKLFARVLACFAWLCLALLNLFASPAVAKSRATADLRSSEVVGLRLAIADFDGDQQPDIASVQVDRDAAQNTRYSIRFQLSTSPQALIGITAPQGGLHISARDMNGDDAIDLVVMTALDSRVIAVLLNDGHGNFSVAEAHSFRTFEENSPERLRIPADRFSDQSSIVQSRFSFENDAAAGSEFYPATVSSSVVSPHKDCRHIAPLRPDVGRSPPLLFHSLA